MTDSDPLPQTGPSDALTGSLPRPPVRTEVLSLDQAITLRDQAPELYDLWLKIAQEKAATANYVDRAPYEIPERLAQAGRPRALGALIVVLSFCGYLAWLGGPGPYIGGLIALVDLAAMLGIFFGLRPDRLSEPRSGSRTGRPDRVGATGLKPLPVGRPQLLTWPTGCKPLPATGRCGNISRNGRRTGACLAEATRQVTHDGPARSRPTDPTMGLPDHARQTPRWVGQATPDRPPRRPARSRPADA